MIHPRQILTIALAALLGVGVSPVAAVQSLEDIAALLSNRGVVFDSTNAHRGALKGMVKSIDPGGSLLTSQEAAALQKKLSPGGTSALRAVELWPEGLAYLGVRQLTAGSGAELIVHLQVLTGGSGVILDLRGTDGMDLPSVVDAVSPYRSSGEVLFTVSGTENATNVSSGGARLCAPLMVLVDRDTACAAEVLAAVFKGCQRVMLIGTPTRGDMRVREMIPLDGGDVIYVATKRVMPAGDAAGGRLGVQPDICVTDDSVADIALPDAVIGGKRPGDQTVRHREILMRVADDPVLRRATDILLGLKALGVHERP
jgi:hypothetical protein